MRCPSCQNPISKEEVSCCSCNFSLIDALERYGSKKVKLLRLHDATDCLEEEQKLKLNQRLDHLEFRFPQINFAAYYGELDPSISLSELSFWLLNQSCINGDLAIDNDSTVLIIVDVANVRTGISLGYLTEQLLSEDDCNLALKAARKSFIRKDFAKGTFKLLKTIEKRLVSTAKRCNRTPKAISTKQHESRIKIPPHSSTKSLASTKPGTIRANEDRILVES